MTNLNYRVQFALTICSVAALMGCQGPERRDATVTGTVLINGQLAEGGTVTFHPAEKGPPAVGRIRTDGSYSVRSGQGNLSDADSGTLSSGEYKITIVVTGEPGEPLARGGPAAAGPVLTASKYTSVDTTDLERTVKPGANLFVFELDGPESNANEADIEDDQSDAESDENTADTDAEETDAEDTSDSDRGENSARSAPSSSEAGDLEPAEDSSSSVEQADENASQEDKS